MSSSIPNSWEAQKYFYIDYNNLFFRLGHFEHKKSDISNYTNIIDLYKNFLDKSRVIVLLT